MCLDSTKQAYFLLAAFDGAAGGHFESRSDVINAARQSAREAGDKHDKSMSVPGIEKIFFDYYLAASIERDDSGFYRTSQGDRQMRHLKEFVYPALAA